jgi:hypothetical protein
MIFLRPTNTNNKPTPKFDPCAHCPDPKLCNVVTGECIVPDMCGGVVKPPGDFICKGNSWISKTNILGCENSFLPSDIDSCNVNDLKCNHGVFYCPKSKGCNGGDLYFFDNGNKCICPEGLLGPNCTFNDSQCKNGGKMKEDGTCICNNTFFGDYCEKVCGENKIYDDTANPPACVCDPLFYDKDGEGCKKKVCGQGKLTNGKCVCDSGFTGDDCNQKICNENQILDDKGNCICPANKDGTQYYGKNCDIYKCNLASEFKYDEASGPSCDCSKDQGSCGQFCEFTKAKNCNNRGSTNCTNNQFINCRCDSGWTGKNCQCDENTKPKNVNPCLGIDYVCGDDGKWAQINLDCTDLINNYGGIQTWSDKCFKEIFDTSKFIDGKINKCNDVTGQTTSNCSPKICAEALGCPSKPTIPCEKGKVGLCDLSTSYNWQCVDQIHTNGNCPPLPKGSYCIKEDNTTDTPMCFQCGQNGGSEWICQNEGALPSKTCLENLGIHGKDYNGYSQSIYINSQDGLPIFPTTDRQQCLKILTNSSTSDPYFNGQFSTYNAAKLFPNPKGTLDQQNNSFTDNGLYFNVHDKDAHCYLTDDDIVTNILKSTGSLCNGNGTFQQNQDTSGNYLPSGSCVCNKGFAGNNCQFSDSKECNGQAKVDINGNCSACSTGFAGKNCQFTIQNCSNQGNPVSTDGKNLSCNCYLGYMGDTCQFSNDNCKKSELPSLSGQASVLNNNLICDYSNSCKSNPDNCRLEIAVYGTAISSGEDYNYLQMISKNDKYIEGGSPSSMINFTLKNTSGFNGVVISTKPIGGSDWNVDNYKINSLVLNGTHYGVPGGDGDEARAFTFYFPIGTIVPNSYMEAQWKETSNLPKIKVHIYLTMETPF